MSRLRMRLKPFFRAALAALICAVISAGCAPSGRSAEREYNDETGAPANGNPPEAKKGVVRVIVSVDWEGADLRRDDLTAFAQLRDAYPSIPIVQFMNPAYFTKAKADSAVVTAAIRMAIRDHDEIGMHLHGWRSLIEAAGVKFRHSPTQTGDFAPQFPHLEHEDCGGEVAISAYTATELTQILNFGIHVLEKHGFGRPPSFRAGAWLLGPSVREALVRAGFRHDHSAIPTSLIYGEHADGLRAMVSGVWGDLPTSLQPFPISVADGWLVEVPNNGGLSDWVPPARMIAIFEDALQALAIDPTRDQIVSIGFHQETADRFVGRFRMVLDHILSRIDHGAPAKFTVANDIGLAAPFNKRVADLHANPSTFDDEALLSTALARLTQPDDNVGPHVVRLLSHVKAPHVKALILRATIDSPAGPHVVNQDDFPTDDDALRTRAYVLLKDPKPETGDVVTKIAQQVKFGLAARHFFGSTPYLPIVEEIQYGLQNRHAEYMARLDGMFSQLTGNSGADLFFSYLMKSQSFDDRQQVFGAAARSHARLAIANHPDYPLDEPLGAAAYLSIYRASPEPHMVANAATAIGTLGPAMVRGENIRAYASMPNNHGWAVLDHPNFRVCPGDVKAYFVGPTGIERIVTKLRQQSKSLPYREQWLRHSDFDDAVDSFSPSVHITGDSRSVVALRGDAIEAWDIESGDQQRCVAYERVPGEPTFADWSAVSFDGTYALAIAQDKEASRVLVVNTTTGAKWPFAEPEVVLAAAWRPHTSHVALLFRDGHVSIWDAATRELVRSFIGNHQGLWGTLMFDREGAHLAAQLRLLDSNNTLHVWNVETGEHRFSGGHGFASNVTAQLDDFQAARLLLVGDTTMVLDIDTGRFVTLATDLKNSHGPLRFDWDGAHIIAGDLKGRIIWRWLIGEGERPARFLLAGTTWPSDVRVDLSPDARWAVSSALSSPVVRVTQLGKGAR